MNCKFMFIFKNRYKILPYIFVYIIKLINIFLKIIRKIKRTPKTIVKKLFAILPLNIKDVLLNNEFFSQFRTQSTARWYIRSDLSIESFFNELNNTNVSYVILRWWEDLPLIELDEDIDILINDKDIRKIKHLITKCVTGQKLDIYTVNGTNGGMYRDIPYYTRNLSIDLLENTVLYKDIYSVPNDEYYFYSLSYHALFHKGIKSGLKGFSVDDTFLPEHDYEKYLLKLTKKIDFNLSIDKSNIYKVLKEKNYLPSIDLLAKLSDIEDSVKVFLPKLSCDLRGGELSLFVIREKTLKDNYLELVKNIITKNFKMEILDQIMLTEEVKEFLSYNMRGSNWRSGPYSKSGGEPALLIIVYDYHPKPVSDSLLQSYSSFTNENLLNCKMKIRNVINSKKILSEQYNSIHTTDNESESLYFLNKIIDKKKYNFLIAEVDKKRNEYNTMLPIVKTLSIGRRSKVELIRYQNNYAIKKTFRKEFNDFFEREVYAHETLSKEISSIPKILEKGENYIITQFYEEITNREEKEKILNKKRVEVFNMFSKLYELGFAHINLTSGNILVSKNEEILLIDFEFLYKYENRPKSLLESYDLVGVPDNLNIDVPSGYSNILNSYTCQWEKIIGKFDVGS